MSRRKHLTQALEQDVEPPGAGQAIVRALGSRGGNIVEVEHPCGRSTLVMLPARFNKKLWVRRGGYLIVDDSAEAAADAGSRVTGTIVAVLYEDHVRQLKKQPGVWPPEFSNAAGASTSGAPAAPGGGGSDSDSSTSSGSGASDGGLAPPPNNGNRRVIYYELSDSGDGASSSDDDSSEGGGDEGTAPAAAAGAGGGAAAAVAPVTGGGGGSGGSPTGGRGRLPQGLVEGLAACGVGGEAQ